MKILSETLGSLGSYVTKANYRKCDGNFLSHNKQGWKPYYRTVSLPPQKLRNYSSAN